MNAPTKIGRVNPKDSPLAARAYSMFLSKFNGCQGTKEYRFIEGKLRPLAERAEKKALKPRAARGTITIRKLDEEFSRRIRERDMTERSMMYGPSGNCCTCNAPITYATSDCGHYLGRQYWATRWHPMNCAAQCRKCNRFNEGMKAQFRVYLVNKYGEEKINLMEATHKLGRKPTAFLMEQIMERIKEIR